MRGAKQSLWSGVLANGFIFILLALLAFQLARLIWVVVTPVGPFGQSQGVVGVATVDPLVFENDPFSAASASGQSLAVTSAPLRLFGTRVNSASGTGSAIIATPDGVQSSFAVGEEIMPGIKLASVALDRVTLDRGGNKEDLYIDQSVPAPVASPSAQPPSPPVSVTNVSSPNLSAIPSVATPPPAVSGNVGSTPVTAPGQAAPVVQGNNK
jgi:general secretion pathway protein C